MPDRPSIDIVIPVHNEAGAVNALHEELTNTLRTLDCDYRIIYVDDGSNDSTLSLLLGITQTDRNVTVLELSRNFGHQAALTAGLSLADCDWVITMDGDGQHPPSLIPRMIALARQGYDIVLTHRLEQRELGLLKRWTSRLFYLLINFVGSTPLEPGGADFRLLNRSALASLRSLPEYHRFLRGMVAWIGFRSTVVPFSPRKRIVGESKYSMARMVRMATNAIFSFSLVPLYLAMMVGGAFLILALAEASYVLFVWLSGRSGQIALGWLSLMFVVLFSGGAILLTLGITGSYVGLIFQEVKRRPVYIIKAVYGYQPVGRTTFPSSTSCTWPSPEFDRRTPDTTKNIG